MTVKEKLQALLNEAQAAKTYHEAQAARIEIARTIDPSNSDFTTEERNALSKLIDSVIGDYHIAGSGY